MYFYGGGFVTTDGSEKRYDHASMASKGVVTVTVNYRLDIVGLFFHAELSTQSGYAGSGSYTFTDQVVALRWVNKNIHSFAGEPRK